MYLRDYSLAYIPHTCINVLYLSDESINVKYFKQKKLEISNFLHAHCHISLVNMLPTNHILLSINSKSIVLKLSYLYP